MEEFWYKWEVTVPLFSFLSSIVNTKKIKFVFTQSYFIGAAAFYALWSKLINQKHYIDTKFLGKITLDKFKKYILPQFSKITTWKNIDIDRSPMMAVLYGKLDSEKYKKSFKIKPFCSSDNICKWVSIYTPKNLNQE